MTRTHTFEVHSFLLASVGGWFWISICKLRNTITKINKHMQSLLAGCRCLWSCHPQMMHPAHFMPPTETALKKNARKLVPVLVHASNKLCIFPSFLRRMAAFHANMRHQISHLKLDFQTLYLKQFTCYNFKYIQIGRISYRCVNMNI